MLGPVLAAMLVAGPPAGAAPFTVVVDAGHGGTNLGTVGTAGPDRAAYEKRVTLELARRIQRRLAGEAGLRVVLCRDADRLLPIRARVRCANEAGARLFLSLHANASPEGPTRGSQRGFEIYVTSADDVVEDARLRALEQADGADAAWAASRQHAAAEDSALFARRLQARLGEALGNDADRGIKQSGAALDVLRGLDMAAVLVEVGFLDHPDEGRLLTSAAGLDLVASALARAVTDVRARDLRAAAAVAAPTGPAGKSR